MWVFTPRGFFSGVADKRDPSTIVVRARKRDHLAKLREVADASPIQTGGGTDYPYRVRMTVDAWVEFAALSARETAEYTNFKSAVKSNADHNVYLRVWSVLHDLSPRRRASRSARSLWDTDFDQPFERHAR